MSYYRLQARAPEPKTKKAAPRFAPPCVRNPLWQGLSAALAIMSLYQIHYSKFPQYRGFNTPTIILGLGGASWGVHNNSLCTPFGDLGAPLRDMGDNQCTVCTGPSVTASGDSLSTSAAISFHNQPVAVLPDRNVGTIRPVDGHFTRRHIQ